MKHFILLLALILSSYGYAQELPFLFKGKVSNSDKNVPEGAVKVSIEQNGLVVSNVQTISNGKYTLRGTVDLSMPFQVTFAKTDFVSKFVQFDMTKMNEEDAPSGDLRPVDQLDIRIFKERENLDFGFLDEEPVVEFEWNSSRMSAIPDMNGANKMKSRIEDMLLEEERNKVATDTKYNQAILEADAAYAKGAYPEALEKYEEALGFKPRETHPLERISELDALILAQQEEELAASQERQAFDNLISAADNLRDQKDFEAAISKYKEALKLKPDEQHPKDQVAILSAKIAQAKKEAALREAYDGAIQLGESFLKQKSFKAAKDKFQEASDLKPSEELPKQRLKEIAAKLNEAKAAQAEREQYKKALAEADALFDAESYKAAKSKYELVLSLEPSSTYAKTRKNSCEEKILEQNQREQTIEKIAALMNSGNVALSRRSYKEAIAAFEAVLKIDNGQLEASEKLKIALQKNEVQTLTEKGDANFNANKFQEAIEDYTAANALITSIELTDKIEAARKRLDQETALAAKNKKYEELIVLADASFESKEWEKARSLYSDALSYTNDKSYAQGQLSQIEKNIANERMVSKRKLKFEKLMLEGQTAFDRNDWSTAVSKYTTALEYTVEKEVIQAKIDEVKSIQEQELILSKQNAKISLLLNQGKAALKRKEYNKAKDKFEEVLSISASNVDAKNELEQVNAKIIELQDTAEKEKAFQKLKKEGYDFADNKEYARAKEKLTQALSLREDSEIREKIANIERKEKALTAQLERQQIFDELMDAAEVLSQEEEYEKAIAKYREASELMPNQAKPKVEIQALEKMRANALKQLKIDEKYAEIIEKGEFLISRKKYLEAIVEFNKALVIKPNEKLPVDRAAEAERLSKESTSELERLVEKNLNVAQKKLDERNYDRALQILNNTEKLDPNNDRLKQMRFKVDAYYQREEDYTKFIADASSMELAKDFVGARKAYEAAIRLKPEEEELIDKIEELRVIIEQEAAKAIEEQLYAEQMSKGKKAFDGGSFDLALVEYKRALEVRENDVEATARMDEVQQVLDNLAVLNAEKIKNKNRFDTIVREADEFFNSNKDYVNAKSNYEAALAIFPNDAYVKLQIDECTNLRILELKKESDKEYQKILSEGDMYFNNKKYDEAQGVYESAVLMRPNDMYPKNKLNKIQAILNPQLVELDQLEDLGTPFEGSILDGQFLLAQAEEERKLLNKLAIGRQLIELDAAQSQMNAEMSEGQYQRSSEVARIQSSMSNEVAQADVNREESLALLRASEKKRTKVDVQNIQYEYAENTRNQEAIYAMNNERDLYVVSQDQEFKEELNQIDNITNALQGAAGERQLQEIDDRNAKSLRFSSVKLKVLDEPMDYSDQRELVYQDVSRINAYMATQAADNQRREAVDRIELENAFGAAEQGYEQYSLSSKEVSDLTAEELKALTKSINDSGYALNGLEKESHYTAMDTLSAIRARLNPLSQDYTYAVQESTADIDLIKLDIWDEQALQYTKEKDQSLEADQKIVAFKRKADSAPFDYEQGHRVVIDVLSERINELQNLNEQEFNAAMVDRSKVQALIDAKTDEIGSAGLVAEGAHAKKIAYVRSQNLKTKQTTAGIEQNDRVERLATEKNVNDIYNQVTLNSAAEIVEHADQSERFAAKQKAIERKNSNQFVGKQESLQNTANQIHGINNTPEKKMKLANSLGEDYPEGVSEESFTQADNNGKMKAIITRRIVVIEGHADVYVRTQTTQAITYSKNGKPSLQHVWNTETQGPHLERHF